MNTNKTSQPTKRFKSSTVNHMPCVIDSQTRHYALFETSHTADNTAKRFNQYAGQDISGYHWNPLASSTNDPHP